MKVRIQKNLLVNALEKMHSVATKGLLPDYNFNGRVTIEVKKTKVVFTSSNGFITGHCQITDAEDDNLKDNNEPGTCTTDAIKIRDSVRKIATEDSTSPIELFDDGNTLTIRDAEAKRKKLVKLPRESTNHKTSVVKRPDGDSMFFETDYFVRGINTVIPFQSHAGYKPEYQVVCFHWVGSEARIVCGDGGCFAIFSTGRNKKDKSKREVKRTIPCSQIDIAAELIGESANLELIWKDKYVLWIQADNGVELLIRGIPDIDYIAYENNAFRFDEAKAYVDIKISDVSEAADLIRVLRDKEQEERGFCHSCFFTAPSIDGNVKFEITAAQGKFQCEYEVPAVYHDLGDQPSFRSKYAHIFFDSPAHAARHSYLRLYLIEESTVVNARDADLGEPDDDGIPEIKDEPDGSSLSFFFAAVKDPTQDE